MNFNLTVYILAIVPERKKESSSDINSSSDEDGDDSATLVPTLQRKVKVNGSL